MNKSKIILSIFTVSGVLIVHPKTQSENHVRREYATNMDEKS
jgi:hypothetical protein